MIDRLNIAPTINVCKCLRDVKTQRNSVTNQIYADTIGFFYQIVVQVVDAPPFIRAIWAFNARPEWMFVRNEQRRLVADSHFQYPTSHAEYNFFNGLDAGNASHGFDHFTANKGFYRTCRSVGHENHGAGQHAGGAVSASACRTEIDDRRLDRIQANEIDCNIPKIRGVGRGAVQDVEQFL